MDVGIYVIQAACRGAMAQPVAVTARELPKTKPRLFNEVEEAIEWTMEFPERCYLRRVIELRQHTAAFLQGRGTPGLRIISSNLPLATAALEATTSRGPLRYQPVHPDAIALQMDDFASCILTGRNSPVAGSMGRDHMAIIEGDLPARRCPGAAAGSRSGAPRVAKSRGLPWL